MTFLKSYIYFSILLLCLTGNAQNHVTKNNIEKTEKEEANNYINQLAKAGREHGALMVKNNRLFREQNKTFNTISSEIQKANVLLKKGINYKNFSDEFKIILDWKEETTKGITNTPYENQTVRDLTTTSILLDELLNRTTFWLKKIQINNTILSESQSRLDSLANEESLYIVPSDSISRAIYYQRYVFLTKDLDPLNIKLTNVLDSIQTLQIRGNILKYAIETDIIHTNTLRKNAFDKLSTHKIDVFNPSDKNEKSFGTSIVYSLRKGIMVFSFYIINHYPNILFMFLFFLSILFYIKLLKKKYITLGIYTKIEKPVLIFQFPIATGILITTTIFQFLLPSPPFIFISVLWLLTLSSISLIVYKSRANTLLFKIWLFLLPIILIAITDNLILLQTTTETWLIISIAILTTIIGVLAIYKRKKINDSFITTVFCFSVFLNLLAIFCMIDGSYDLGKISITNGVYTLFILASFLYTYNLFNDIIIFSNYLKDTDEEKKIDSLTDPNNNPIPKRIYVLFFIGCLLITRRNNYSFQSFFVPILDYFSESRQIGDFTFSFKSIFLFIFIIVISGVISKIVSFLASDTKSTSSNTKSRGLGSYLLLIRIGIIGAGVLITFASAGIPLDRITIIISALGVGIGFGLQTLVNNLVSGLIIAFEKPVNLDDIIEINGQIGTMKSIGIRSSVISTWDGADVIIPNGDLLSQHLTNWTVGSSKRRFEIQVGVAYGSDLTVVKNILNDVLMNNQLVLKNPMPMIWVSKFSDSSIDYSIKYWVPHFNFGNDVRSELLIATDEAFKDKGIEIPFPQQDIHIQSEIKNTNNNNLEKDN